MSSHLVNGVVLPDQVAGHPGLELCNTRAGWGTAAPREYLTGDHALALWAIDAGLVPGPLPRRIRARPGPVTVRAVSLREALYAAALGRGRAADWDAVGQAAAAARADALFRPAPGETAGAAVVTGAHAEWDLTLLAGSDPALAALHSAALAAEDLLRSPLAAVVSACPAEGCGWLFADRRRRRRWCSMAVCGNRAKARRHASRGSGRGELTT